ncbi:MAG: pectinesterase family protein [Fibrobacter sp.]|nr:pectinesterase family protein [Fibrobacter sp.]
MNTKFSGTFSISALALMLASNAFAVAKHGIDFVVGKDGDFKAAMAKAAASGASESKRFIIFFPDGEYELTKLTGDEHGKTTFSTSHVSFIGQSADKSVIWNTTDTEGISVTATLYFPKNSDIYMQDLTVQNRSTFKTSEAGRQVAIQQIGDKFIYKNVKLLSGQDTYYTKKNGGSKTYWEGGQIKGTVDFICGDGDVFFEGTKLTMDRSGGYITASQNSTDWGYVFNNTTIEVSNGSYNGTFYLGRSWGHAKTVFLNTKMVAQPKAEGWGPDMNSAPVVFGEYNSKDGNGNAVNTNSRKTRFDGGKDGSTATTLKTVWNASDAAKYTLANVLGGSDNWDPTKFTKQVGAPKISQQGANIEWSDDDNAICWVVFVNGKYHSNTTSPSIDVGDISAGSKVTVRAANSMGGLGSASNEIEVLEANVDYVTVKTSAEIGGEIQMSPNREKVAEGTKVTFTAIANDGWKFAGWTGKNAADAGASDTWTTTAAADIEIGAKFTGDGSNTFQAESGTIENAIIESTNAGFKGSGYINFGTGTSSVKVPVYVAANGEYKATFSYANGSGSARSLSISTDAGTNEEMSFEATGAWTTYLTKELSMQLKKGASYITFSIVGGNDGPNLDQIVLEPVNVEEDPVLCESIECGGNGLALIPGTLAKPEADLANKPAKELLFTVNGQLVRQSVGASVNTSGLQPGIYLIKTIGKGYSSQRTIRVE